MYDICTSAPSSSAVLVQMLLLVLLSLVGSMRSAIPPRQVLAQQHEQQSWTEEPVVGLSRLEKKATAKDLEWFLSKSLHLDLAHWRGRQLSMFREFEAMRAAKNSSNVFGGGDTVKLVLIHNNRWLLPDNNGDITVCEEPCYWHAHVTQQQMNKAMEYMPIPDMVFFYNSGDYSRCRDRDVCPVPMLTHIKTWLQDGVKDLDILIPQLHFMPNELYDFPWDKKEPLAFFRGSPFCADHGFRACSRVYLSYRSRFHEADKPVQIGLTMDYGTVRPHEDMEQEVKDHGHYIKHPPIPVKEHARFRWLASLDGISASYRFGQLLHINSVVLKQRSGWIEFFYRALEPNKHYLEFWTRSKDDIFELVPQLNQQYEANSSAFHAMAARSQEFASMFLSPRARFLYWRAALLAYRSLLPDMDQYVAAMVAQLKEQGKLR